MSGQEEVVLFDVSRINSLYDENNLLRMDLLHTRVLLREAENNVAALREERDRLMMEECERSGRRPIEMYFRRSLSFANRIVRVVRRVANTLNNNRTLNYYVAELNRRTRRSREQFELLKTSKMKSPRRSERSLEDFDELKFENEYVSLIAIEQDVKSVEVDYFEIVKKAKFVEEYKEDLNAKYCKDYILDFISGNAVIKTDLIN